MDPRPLLIVWALLIVAMLGFAAYRLVTDRRSGDRRNAMYPVVSNPSDGFFPDKGDHVTRIAYALMSMGMVGFLILLYDMTLNPFLTSDTGNLIARLMGVCILGALVLLGIAHWKQKRAK